MTSPASLARTDSNDLNCFFAGKASDRTIERLVERYRLAMGKTADGIDFPTVAQYRANLLAARRG